MLVAQKSYYGTYGSYAYKPEVVQKEVVKKKKKAKTQSKVAKSFMLLSIVTVIGFIIVLRYVALAEMASSVNKQKQMLSGLEKSHSQMQTEMMIDLKTVDEIAKNKLGMDRPYSYQVQYVNVNDAADAGKLSANETSEKSFSKKISKIVEFLY